MICLDENIGKFEDRISVGSYDSNEIYQIKTIQDYLYWYEFGTSRKDI